MIRAWAENQVTIGPSSTLGLDTFGGIAAVLADRVDEAEAGPSTDAPLAATILLATVERLVYFVTSRPLGLEPTQLLDELAGMLHRGFFGGQPPASPDAEQRGRGRARTSRRSR